MPTSDHRDHRKATSLLQTESRWLQRALFALNKAREARAKLAEGRGVDPDSIRLKPKNGYVTLAELEGSIAERVEVLVETLNERRRLVMPGTRTKRSAKGGAA